MTSGAQLFSNKDQASAYAKYRPTYPDELYEAIYEFAGPPEKGVALDVAAGSGQAAAALAKRYRTVHAQDASAEQIAAAPVLNGVHFELATAEDNGLPHGSVDLVTVAQAMHWFDIPAFYKETARVLRPGGAIAIWTYDLGTFVGEPAATAAFVKLFQERLGEYWDPRMLQAMSNQYQGLEPGPPHFADVRRHTFTKRVTMTIDQVLGWIRSWSGYASWKASKAPGPDPLMVFHGDLKDALEFKSHSDEVTVEFMMHLVLARRTA